MERGCAREIGVVMGVTGGSVPEPPQPPGDDSGTILSDPKVTLVASLASAIGAAVAVGDLGTARVACRAIAQILDRTSHGEDAPAPLVLLPLKQPNRR